MNGPSTPTRASRPTRKFRVTRTRATAAAAAIIVTTVGAIAGTAPWAASAAPGSTRSGFTERDLIRDVAHQGQLKDASVKNPWGIALGPTTPLWVANNDTAVATIYAGATGGSPGVTKVPLTVDIPKGSTGQVFNSRAGADPHAFVVTTKGKSSPALFIFDSLGGQLAGWSGDSGTSAQVKRTVHGAVYTGLAMARVKGHDRLFAADAGPRAQVDVFDSTWHRIGSFTDPALARRGLTPYNVATLNGRLYVSFAPPEGSSATPAGAIDVFSTSGHMVRRLVTGGVLDGPWGMVLAPAHWGPFGGDLIVGNEDGGHINAFSTTTGALEGTIKNASGRTFAHDGLWGLAFGNGMFGQPNSLIFVAGVGEYAHGLIGLLTPNG